VLFWPITRVGCIVVESPSSVDHGSGDHLGSHGFGAAARKGLRPMYLNDLLPPGTNVAAYKSILTDFSKLVEDSVRLLGRTTAVAEKAASNDGKYHHISVFALCRHICELLDGVAVLALEGCAIPCQPMMRSAMEAYLGVLYILESKSEQRAWAYQVAHAHRRIKLYRSLDPHDASGKQTRAMMSKDPIASGMQLPQADWQKLIANLEKLFQRPECMDIEVEWQRLKQRNKGKDPHWYSLFGGPQNARALAECVSVLAQYEFCYRHWSNLVHAGGCLENYVGGKDGRVNIRPLRNPEGLQSAVVQSIGYCMATARRLLEVYGTPEDMEGFRRDYTSNIKPRSEQLNNGELINVPWK
jgi:hypothetical protein